LQEHVENTKRVIRSRKTNKARQYNGRKKPDKKTTVDKTLNKYKQEKNEQQEP